MAHGHRAAVRARRPGARRNVRMDTASHMRRTRTSVLHHFIITCIIHMHSFWPIYTSCRSRFVLTCLVLWCMLVIFTAKSSYAVESSQDQIMNELMTNGPIEAAFTVYADFLSYKSGLYFMLLRIEYCNCICCVRGVVQRWTVCGCRCLPPRVWRRPGRPCREAVGLGQGGWHALLAAGQLLEHRLGRWR